MSPSHVAEPTYEAIRKRLMIGAWPMGHRLEAGRLAEVLGVSITPVRDALNRLVGEKLVGLVPGIGFHVPHLTERRLRDLLDFNLMLLLGAVRIDAFLDSAVTVESVADTHAVRTDMLFARVAARSGNVEWFDAVKALGVRLHATRLQEISVLPDAATDLELIEAALPARNYRISSELKRYHEIRKGAAARLIERLHVGNAA